MPEISILLPLVVAVPAVLAVLMPVLGHSALRVVPLLGVAATGAIVLWGVAAVVDRGTVLSALGGWTPPLGITLRADGLSAAFLLMTTVVMAAVAILSLSGDRHDGEGASAHPAIFWSLLLFLWAGLNTVFVSRDLFNLYVALEVTGLSGVAMVALSGGAVALRAQMRYLLFATVGSLLYLMGVALLYAELGVLDSSLMAERIEATPPALAAAVLMTLGLLIKTAIWPLHFWLPPAHSSAPPAVSAVLSGLVVKASLYLLVRLWFEVFPGILTAAAWTLLGVLGAIAVLWGSLLALRQERLKLMIAYSTVAQLGYMMFVFPLAAPGSPFALQAWNGAVLQMLSHGIAKAAMFLSAGAVVAALGGDERSRLVGGSRSVPVPLFAMALAGLSIMSLPPSGGFLAKWFLMRSALGAAEWWLVFVLFAGGLMAAGYVLRFLLPAFRPLPEDAPSGSRPVGSMAVAALTLALASLALGLASGPVVGLIEAAVPFETAEGA